MSGRESGPSTSIMFSYCLGAIQEDHGLSSKTEVGSEDGAPGNHQLIVLLAAGWNFFLEGRSK